ncbi:hypothetical protein MMC22_007393 [Lobaria immixta]|nr:hypothetical protein [Lobaria immixta]
MSSNDLFVAFLEGTDHSVGEDITFASRHIQMLLASAENGFTPAQAVINRVLESYDIEWPIEYAEKRLCWLSRGTAAGCLIAKSNLMKIDSGLAQNETATFLKEGAFRKHYSTQLSGEKREGIENQNRPARSYQAQNHRNSRTSFGPDPKLASFSVGQETDASIEIHTISKAEIDLRNCEMLYMACMAGCSKDVRRLCHDGVNAGFLESRMGLLACIGIRTSDDIFSVPPEPPEGLSALDIAVANYDWAILETIVAAGCKETGICDSDEEGYTPFHRLEGNWIGHALPGSRYWHGAFWGSRSDRYDNILRTINTLQVMGGDINRLTSPSESNPRKRKNDRPGSLTPLMLAARKADIDAARALLACGADPNTRNNIGINALSQLPESSSPGVSFRELGPLVELLLSMGTEPLDPSPFMEWCPLASAIDARCLEAISLIVDAGADPLMKQQRLVIIAELIRRRSILGRGSP